MQYIPEAIVETVHAESLALESALIARYEPLPVGFAYLDEAAPGIKWDAKYAGSDNFTGASVDGYEANRIVVSLAMADALVLAQEVAQGEGYSLLVWDAARPQRAVDRFVTWSKEPEDGATRNAHYPRLKKTQLFGEYIAKRSGHSRGAAVDLTLIDEDGEPLDMGGTFDLMDARSHHGAKGLSRAQTKNRALLKRIMNRVGFKAYASEWWHYSLKNEPFPGEYFDFVITQPLAPMPTIQPGVGAPLIPSPD